MFAIVLIAIVVAVIARLVTGVRTDRPVTTPRTHSFDLDTQSTRLFRVV